MKTHLIKDGVIVNTILATVEEAEAAYPDYECRSANDGAPGWEWDGENPVRPEEPPKPSKEKEALDVLIDELVKSGALTEAAAARVRGKK